MQATCFEKCIHKYAEPEITAGEGACIDRCVLKYTEVHKQVGLRFKTGSFA